MTVSSVLHALREPEAFTLQWSPDRPPPLSVLAALAMTASVGVGLYGAAMHAWQGGAEAAVNAGAAVAAAGIAWNATLPSLYVLGTFAGSRLPFRSLVLATLVTVSFGGVAMLASIPVLWFFELCAPHAAVRLLVTMLVFAGVGLSMSSVFLRVMNRLEGTRLLHLAWLGLLSVVGAEMFWVVGLFNF